MAYQRVGAHVSAAGGVENAPANAYAIGAECFQFFSRSPRGGSAPTITNYQAESFRADCKKYGMESYIHTPYYINFASQKKNIASAAPRILREELERASTLGVKYVITHLGSAHDWPEDSGKENGAIKQVIEGIKDIYKGELNFSAKLLLELSAGAGHIIGGTFEELGYILKNLNRADVHICLDTCHMFASGYDVRTSEAVANSMKKFKEAISISSLKLVHANDSKAGLDEHKDRHEHITKGQIGAQGFKAILSNPDFKKVNFVLETPHDDLLPDDIKFLKDHRLAV
jgi:deoxyribonuclease-4